jgi:DNA-binding response OmpR family regulator
MPADPLAATDGSPRTRTILVVDDEPDVRDFVRRVLTQGGYQVIVAARADEALALFQDNRRRFDLVISDVLMPGSSGAELALALRELQSDLRIVLMSGFTGDRLHPNLLPRDIPILEKPFKVERLLATVHAALGS